tara:strand:- start:341 stop:649 length:309 start_codon:yes stop_codon:yes gene_type:complete
MDTANLVKRGEKMKNPTPIDLLDIVNKAYTILDNSEGVTKEMINEFKVVISHFEEESVTYVAQQDFLLDQEAQKAAELTTLDIENMHEEEVNIHIDLKRDTI